MELQGKTVLIIGLKRTGVSVARFVARAGGRVRVTDRQEPAMLATELASLAGLPLELFLGSEDPACLAGVDLVVPSPGVPRHAPLLLAAVHQGIPVCSEIELAYHFLRCPLLAVTGTNGKSTTTTLLGAILRQTGQRIFVGGNLGIPLIEAAMEEYAAAVAEVSSFQLEWVERLRPRVGVWLNLTEDHLDRHGSFAVYGAAKRALFTQQEPSDWAVINRDDSAVQQFCQGLPGRIFSFGWTAVQEGAWIDGCVLKVRYGGRESHYTLSDIRLRGRHNYENIMAAVSAATVWGVPQEVIAAVLPTFAGLPHRLQFVACKRGVSYFDDSKATNVGAVVQSLASFPGRVILLAGGVDKGGDYEPLRPLVRERVKTLILFGQAKETIRAALARETEAVLVDTLPEAVRQAAVIAEEGDTVLLAPACASFDQFRDYAHRGQVFRMCVEGL
ncbi:MAG: UDP-N-acetylmuramoyl-L-alanine--D-glutamate ligase [Candidatus Binatia bacterium]|nr:UDP-N-acetylmuramoyl-L-alanine--D-glutamate ligase [Candidatus Binatia bacterium]